MKAEGGRERRRDKGERERGREKGGREETQDLVTNLL